MDIDSREDLQYVDTRRVTCLTCRSRLTEDIYLTLCGVEQCLPGFTVGPRVRDNYHLHVIISGKGTLETEGREYHLHTNQVFLLKPGKEVYYRADDEDPWRYCWISFNGRIAQRYMDMAGFVDHVSALDCTVDSQVFLGLTRQILDCSEIMVYNDLRRLGLTLEFISSLMEACMKSKGHMLRHSDFSPEVYVQYALDLVHDNYDKVRVDDMARYIGINRSYLTYIFKKKTGMSPQQYLMQFKLKKARDLLMDTDLPIQDIAAQVGYDNPLTFSKIFKSYFGESPRTYRTRKDRLVRDEA